MPGATDDFSLDPIQLQADEIARIQARAMAQRLRTPPDQLDVYGQGQRAFQDVSTQVAEAGLPAKRQALSDQYQKGLVEALRGVDPDIAAMVMNPSTRQQGLALAQKQKETAMTLKRMRDLDEMDRAPGSALTPGTAEPGPSGPSVLPSAAAAAASAPVDPALAEYQQQKRRANQFIRSGDANLEKIGQEQLKQLEPNPRFPGIATTLTGKVVRLPGGDDALRGYKATEADVAAEHNVVQTPSGFGTQEELQSEKLKRLRQGNSPASTPSALPASTGAAAAAPPVGGPISPVSAAPSPSAVSAGATPADVSDNPNVELIKLIPRLERYTPDNPVSEKGALGPFQIMPDNVQKISARVGRKLDPMNPQDGAFMANTIMDEARRRYDPNDEAVIAYYNGGIAAGNAVAAGKSPPSQQTQDYLDRFRYLAGTTSGVGTNMVAGTGAPGSNVVAGPGGMVDSGGGMPKPEDFLPEEKDKAIKRPVIPLGTTDRIAEKRYSDQLAAQDKSLETYADAGNKATGALSLIDDIKKLNNNPRYQGSDHLVRAQMFGDQLARFMGGEAAEQYRNTSNVEQGVNSLVLKYIDMFKSRMTDFDLKALQRTMPTLEDDPKTTTMKLASMERLVRRTIDDTPVVQRMVGQSYTLAEAIKAVSAYHEVMDKGGLDRIQPEPTNPTPAGGRSAPPAAGSGATGDWGAPPPSTPGQGPINPKTGKPLWVDAGGPPTPVWDTVKDTGRTIAALPVSLVTQGIPAAADTIGNWWEGGKEAVGMGDRKAGMADVARQEELRKTNPSYDQARAFTDVVANPLSYIGGGTASIVKQGLLSGLQEYLQPHATASEALTGGTQQGILGAKLAILAKILPSILHGDITRGFKSEAPMARELDTFKSVTPTSVQINPNTFEAKIANWLGLNDTAALPQLTAISKDLKSNTPLLKEISNPGIRQAEIDMGAEYDKLLPKGVKVKIGTDDKAALSTVIGIDRTVEDTMGKSPALAKVYQAIKSDTPSIIPASELHQAWKDVSSVASGQQAGQIRTVLGKLIDRAIPAENKGAFQAMNKQWGNLEDIKRIYQGGEGAVEGQPQLKSAVLSADSIKSGAGHGPQVGVPTDTAAELRTKLALRDPRTETATGTVLGTVENFAKDVVGGGIYHADKAIQTAGKYADKIPGARYVIEALRRPAMFGEQARKDTQHAP